MLPVIVRHKGHGLGCKFARDPRDAMYPLRKRLAELDWKNTPERRARWKLGPILNQGQTSECTRYALAARRGARPIHTPDPLAEIDYKFYDWAIHNDEWPEADPDAGTSVRAMCQAARLYGVVSNFYTTADVRTLCRYVRRFGPLVVGTEWTSHMFDPDAAKFVYPNGAVAGGHAYACVWVQPANPAPDVWTSDDVLTFQQSWGDDWGDRGLFYMRAGDFAQLLEDRGGEAYEPVEKRHKPKPRA